MKRFYVPLLLLLVCALVITGCSSGSSTTPAATAPAVTTTTVPTSSSSVQPTASSPAVSTSAPPATTTKPTAAPPPASAGTQKRGGTLIDIESSGPGTPFGWPPDLTASASTAGLIGLDSLIHEDYKGVLSPNLAESYEAVTDPSNASITFHLRRGVKFHDGTDFNAQAVKWNLDMIKTGVNASTIALWKSWEVLDDYTIKVNFTTWQNILVRSFGSVAITFCSPTAYQKNGVDWMRWNMVGTGAFKQVEYVNDVRLVTTKFNGYWEQGKPYLDGLTLLFVTDQMTRLALFKSGGGDVMGVSPKDAADLQKAGYTIISYPAAAFVLVPDSMNANSPWANVKVRMAAEYAINKEAMSSGLGYGFQPPAYQLPQSASTTFIPNLPQRKYDVAKAKQLLSEAGYPNGFKTTIITASFLDRDGATAIQAYFAAVGIQASIDFVEAARLGAVLTGTWTGILYHQLRPFPSFGPNLLVEFGSPVSTFYKSLKKPDGWQAIFDAALRSEKEEPALMQKANQALYDDCTMIPVYYYSSIYATQNYVHDTGRGAMSLSTQFQPYNAWLDK